LRGKQNRYTGEYGAEWSMKRYLIFAALGPLLGGFLLLVATTVMSGYWHQADLS